MEPNQNKRSAIDVGGADFETQVLRADVPVLVFFWAPWSQPCQVLRPIFEEMVAMCGEKAKVVGVNADDHPDLSLWYEVQSIPTILYFLNGSLRARIIGTASKEAILAKLQLLSTGQEGPLDARGRPQ